MARIKKVLASIAAQRSKIGTMAIGWSVDAIIEWFFSYVIYPYILWRFGIKIGLPIVLASSFIFCLIFFKFYKWSERDWFGIEYIKEIREYKGDSFFKSLLRDFLKMGNWAIFLFISIKYDAFKTTIYMKKDGGFTDLTQRDKTIFVTSFLIGSIFWWSTVCGVLFGGEFLIEHWDQIENFIKNLSP